MNESIDSIICMQKHESYDCNVDWHDVNVIYISIIIKNEKYKITNWGGGGSNVRKV